MPIFNWNAAQSADPQSHLATYCLQVGIEIGYHPVVEKFLLEKGLDVPAPIAGNGIIDTGASRTAIDVGIAEQLRLVPIGTAIMGTASGQKECPTYAFTIQIGTGLRFDCVPGSGCDLTGQNFIALIGMDLLSRCVLNVNGPAGMVTIAM